MQRMTMCHNQCLTLHESHSSFEALTDSQYCASEAFSQTDTPLSMKSEISQFTRDLGLFQADKKVSCLRYGYVPPNVAETTHSRGMENKMCIDITGNVYDIFYGYCRYVEKIIVLMLQTYTRGYSFVKVTHDVH